MTPNRIFIKDQSAIPLGMQGDGNVREIVFSPPDELAGKTWTASHQRATDPEPYPVALRADEDKLIWLVSAADTDVAGQGRFQLVCLDGDDQVLKTMVYRTHVSASLSTPGDVPDPVKPWYDALMRELADIGDIPPEEIEQAVRDYLTEHPFAETDPTVPDWAKQPEKPTYTAEDVGALAQDALQDAIDQALAQAKNSGEFDGEKGSPGKDGITPHIGGNGNWYLGDNDTGKPSRGDPGTPGKNGVDGTSVTVQTVAESTEDGGENVVTFSDGKTLTVKNGKKGANGVDGHTPIRGTDYYTEADKREIVDDVLEQMPSGGGDVTLGIAGAMVGQIAKITAVDADGKPTAWEPVNMTGGGGYVDTVIADITIDEEVQSYDTARLTSEKQEALLSADQIFVYAVLKPPTSASSRGRILIAVYGSYYNATTFFASDANRGNAAPSSSAQADNPITVLRVRNLGKEKMYTEMQTWCTNDNQYPATSTEISNVSVAVPNNSVIRLQATTAIGAGSTCKIVTRRFLE